MEVELKLLVAPERLARIERHPQLAGARRRRKETLHTVYFDTPDFDLMRAGVALRLRQNGARWIQTLKGSGQAVAGLHMREELEWEVPGNTIDFGVLAGTPYAELFAQPGLRDRLVPVFATKFDRSARTVAFADGTALELAVDRGEIRAGKRRSPISEAELELTTGDPQRLFDMARTIAHDVPLRLGHASKAERGYALARRTRPAPRKARAVALDDSLTAAAALQRIALACITQMQANEDGVLAGRDPEYLHQLRVGLRRLRSCVALVQLAIGKESVKLLAEELRWLQGALGPARDWDVFLAETLAPLSPASNGTRGLAAFRTRCVRLRRMHAGEARATVSSPRYTELMLALGEAFARDDLDGLVPVLDASAANRPDERPKLGAGVREFAAFVLADRDRRLRKRGASVPRATPEARHEVRIAAKKLRYAAEFFSSLYPQRNVEPYVAALERLQDILGALNDASVVDRLLAEVAATGKTPVAPYVEYLVRGRVAVDVARAIADYEVAWRRFARAKPFWS